MDEIFRDGCDRCDAKDLELLENAGLMDCGVYSDTFGMDSLEIGETMWTFNNAGKALVASILHKKDDHERPSVKM